jgi:UPF0755 protein
MTTSGNSSKRIKIWFILLLAAFAALAALFYGVVYYGSIHIPEKSRLIYIHTGWNYDETVQMLETKKIIRHPHVFTFIAGIKGYKDKIKAGRYRVQDGMNMLQLINLLRSGKQEPEKVTLENVTGNGEIAAIMANKMESDSAAFMKCLNDNAFLKQFGFTPVTVLAMFIPGTYNLLWTDSPDSFLIAIHSNYEQFWTAERRQKARDAKLSPLQVSILASIVEAEQSRFDDEKPVIAGLYINRLRKGMPLQSDPTAKYGSGNLSIQRVYSAETTGNSAYNTYIHEGLPPGPINMPRASSIDAVLNYSHNDYLYMCAAADGSFRHHFSSTLKEHDEYAKKYREYLNKRGIY